MGGVLGAYLGYPREAHPGPRRPFIIGETIDHNEWGFGVVVAVIEDGEYVEVYVGGRVQKVHTDDLHHSHLKITVVRDD